MPQDKNDDDLMVLLTNNGANRIADTISELRLENAELLKMNTTQAATITTLRNTLKEIIEWTERHTSPGHPITTVANRALHDNVAG